MLPVECPSRALVMVMHSHPHLCGKRVLVTFDISTDPRLQEGLVWGYGFSDGGRGHEGVGHNRGQGDGSGH